MGYKRLTWKKIKNLGFDEIDIQNAYEELCEDNIRTVNKVSLLLILILAVITVFYMCYDNKPVRDMICVGSGIFMTFIFYISRKMLNGRLHDTAIQADRMIYLFSAACFLVGIYLGTFAAVDEMAVAPVWMFFFAILIFNRLPVQNLIVVSVSLIFFLFCSYLTKSAHIFRYDVMHAVTSILASIVVSWQKSRMKVENILALNKLRSANLEIRETVEEKERETRLLRHKASRDELTGLYKKNIFEEKVIEILDHGGRAEHALVCIDIDNFKEINDTFGHLFGDRVLQDTADLLREGTSEEELIDRFGGDEFCIFFPAIRSRKSVEECMADILGKGCRVYRQKDVCRKVSLSMGIAYCPNTGISYRELFSRADEALYYSKKCGKNTCRISQKN